MQKKFTTQTASVVLTLVFLVTGYFFFGTFAEYVQTRGKFSRSQKTLTRLKIREREIDRKKRVLEKVKAFVEKARALGLERDRWDSYDVEINRAVSFEKATEILNQTTSTKSYYFKPVHFQIGKDLNAGNGSENKGNSSEAKMADSLGDGDIYINLKGSFLARVR